MRLAEGYDMASVDQRSVDCGFDPQAGNAAGVIVDLRYLALEHPAPYKYLFLETVFIQRIPELLNLSLIFNG